MCKDFDNQGKCILCEKTVRQDAQDRMRAIWGRHITLVEYERRHGKKGEDKNV